MAKEKRRHSKLKSAGPDDPICQEGRTTFTPMSARPKPPEPNKPPDVEEEPPKD